MGVWLMFADEVATQSGLGWSILLLDQINKMFDRLRILYSMVIY